MLILHHRRQTRRPTTPVRALVVTISVVAAILLLAGSLYAPAASAQTSTDQTAAALAQSFELSGNSKDIVAGSLVSSRPSNKNTVELASIDNASRLIGIVANDPLVTIVDNKNTVSVVISGKAQALVSDINGPLKAGDKITASPIAGIGMRATLDSQVIGTLQAGPSQSGNTTTRSVKDTDGKAHTIKISKLPVQLSVGFYQLPGGNIVPPFIQRTADHIAGEPVSVTRIIFAGIIMVASLCSIITLMYATARNSIQAIGRNPLAASLIYKGMYRVGVLALIILVFGTLLSYLVLKI